MKKQVKKLELNKVNVTKLSNTRAIMGGGEPPKGSGSTYASNTGTCYTDMCD